MTAWVRRWFDLEARGARIHDELGGGVTTFVTMAYIVVLNPAILAAAGIPPGPSTIATILVAGFGSIAMGLVANRPIAVAPYMGENAFIAFGLASLGIGWQLRIGAVFVSGLIFLVVTLLGVRGWLANSIGRSMKHAFGAGIGLFLCFIGLYETGLVKSYAAGKPAASLFPPGVPADLTSPIPGSGIPVPLEIGSVTSLPVLIAVFGIVLIAVLISLRLKGAILIGMTVTGALGIALGMGHAPHGIAALPRLTGPDGLAAIAGQLRFSETLADGRVVSLFSVTLLPVLLTLFLMDFLDTIGTLVGVGSAGNMLDENGNFPQIERPMLVDAGACVVSALLGTSTSGAYIESAAGIKDGARTGLASVVTGGLFLASLFFIPLVEPLQSLEFAYGPALVVVGVLMTSSIARIEFDDLTESLPALLTILMMVFTTNIANGLTAGLVVHPIVKVATGRFREVTGGMWVLAALCALYYLSGLLH